MKRRTKHTQRKTGQKRRSSPAARKFVPPRNVEEFFGMPEAVREMLIEVAGVVSKMRSDRISLTKASREFGVSPRTVKRLAAPALRKLSNGRYAAKGNDRIFRVVIAVTRHKGPVEVATTDFRQASKAGKHSAAVQRYMETGDNSALARFKNKYIVDARGKRIALMTDLDDLDRLGSAGETLVRVALCEEFVRIPKIPKRDPVGARRRATIAARRVGIDSRCSCGETRPEALISGSKPTMCAACKRTQDGRTSMDAHHVAGKANSPITVPVPVNDHRGCLSVAQADWPKSTLMNVHGSPLLAAAACVRGLVDMVFYLIERGLPWTADMLEALDELLVAKLGSRWWVGTEIERFAPEKKRLDD